MMQQCFAIADERDAVPEALGGDEHTAAYILRSFANMDPDEHDITEQSNDVEDVTDTLAHPPAAFPNQPEQKMSFQWLSIPCKLTSVCMLSPLVDEIRRTCVLMKQVQLESIHISNLHVRRCLLEGIDIPTISSKFFYDCCTSALTQIERRDRHSRTPRYSYLHSTLLQYWDAREKVPGFQSVKLVNASHMICSMAKLMETNAKNMIALEFRRRLYQYIRFRFRKVGQTQLTHKETTKLVNSCYRVTKRTVVGVDGNETIATNWQEWDETHDPVELQLRRWLQMVPWTWTVRDHCDHFLHKLNDMLKCMEYYVQLYPRTKGAKLYSLLPVASSFSANYVNINGTTLFGLLSRIIDMPEVEKFLQSRFNIVPTRKRKPNTDEAFAAETFQRRRKEIMRVIFGVTDFETSTYEFADTVRTNGYGAYILLRRPVTGTKATCKFDDYTNSRDTLDEFGQELLKLGPYYAPDVLIGIDPGMRTLCTAASVGYITPRRHRHRKWRGKRKRKKRYFQNHSDAIDQDIVQLSSDEYRHMAKLKHFDVWYHNLRKRERFYDVIVDAMPSFKTASYDLYFQRLQYFWMNVRFLLAFNEKHPFLRWRFTRGRLKAKAMDALAKRVVPVPSPQVCIAYGNWSRQAGIRGHPNVPVKGFAKALQKRATVLPMDEYRTSQLCSCCHARLKQARLFTKVRRRDGEIDIRLKTAPSTKESKEILEMSKWKKAKLKDTKTVLRCNRNVLRCTNSGCKAHFWNRDVNAARNMLELLKSGLRGEYGQRRPIPFRRGA